MLIELVGITAKPFSSKPFGKTYKVFYGYTNKTLQVSKTNLADLNKKETGELFYLEQLFQIKLFRIKPERQLPKHHLPVLGFLSIP